MSNTHPSAGDQLQQLVAGGFWQLRRLPPAVEQAFRAHFRSHAASILHQSVYGLIGIYLLVVVPISIFSADTAFPQWLAFAVLPIGIVLTAIWVTTRLPAFDPHVETTLGIGLFICLGGTLYCAMLLGDSYFGRIAAYESIYILVIAFTILRLAAHLALTAALAGFASALVSALALGLAPDWLEMLLYFLVPLILCTVTGLMLEHSERRNFLQQRLLQAESERLETLRRQAEAEAERQQRHAAFLQRLAGNPNTTELCQRVLEHLITSNGACIGVLFQVTAPGWLRAVCQWGGAPAPVGPLRAADSSLLGPALRQRTPLQVRPVPAGYLRVHSGSLDCDPCELLLVPVWQGNEAVALIELGKLSAFSDRDRDRIAEALPPFAYALVATDAREQLAGAGHRADVRLA